jgi:acetolactate synthase-1/2/3 large subunit
VQLQKVAELIKNAKRPVILCGRGVLISGAEEELMELSHKANIPVGWTLLGTGAFPLQDPLALQMVGFMGAGYTNKSVNGADLLMMIGMRCDDRVTTKIDSFAPNVENIVHIDIDPAEIGKNIKPQVPVVGDAKSVLKDLIPLVEPKWEQEWLTQIEQWKEEHPVRYVNNTGLLQPQEVARTRSGRPSGSTTTSRVCSSTPGGPAAWASPSPRRWGPSSPILGGGSSASPARAASS